MKFFVYADLILIGWSLLENGDFPMGCIHGVFFPVKQYSAIHLFLGSYAYSLTGKGVRKVRAIINNMNTGLVKVERLIFYYLFLMTQATLVKIINQLETLELGELEQLNQAIQTRLNVADSSEKMTKFYESLLTSGFIRQQKSPSSGQIRQPLIEVKGKPISETIIEERR